MYIYIHIYIYIYIKNVYVCSTMKNLCCKQVKETNTCQSYRTKETFQIFHNFHGKAKT